jgi:large subunit ribosomal protein L23
MKPVVTEKAVMLIEMQNTLLFELDKRMTKTEIKKEFEEIFNVKVEKVNTLIKHNKKYAYIKLNKSNPAIDVATKLGLI